MNIRIHVIEAEPYGVVSPRLYGHFAEHLGRCCYDGLWVGPEAAIPNQEGFRSDVISALRAMPTPMLRWPGGCYADHYHWRDGIGTPEKRPERLGLSCGRSVLDDNGLGTHEFLRLCEIIGAEPYLAGNMGSGSVQEMCDWVEYCNTAVPTTLQRERAANGRQTPWGIKLWGVGNENWGCGGCYDPESYALEYRRYASMLRHVDPSIEMVFCGHEADWNQRSLSKMHLHAGLMDHFSIHRYWIGGGPGSAFSDEDYYRLLAEADQTEEFVKQTRMLLDDLTGGKRHIGIALDEWGVWHPEARTWGPNAVPGEAGDYGQACTMRDALATAAALEGFHRQCASLSLANLAQVVNVLHAPILTDGDQVILTPTYHVLKLHAPHIGAQAYRTEVDGTDTVPGGPAVSATATSGGITVVNRHLNEMAEVRLKWPQGSGKAMLLTSAKVSDENTSSEPAKVTTVALPVKFVDGEAYLELPPHSVATLTV
ncbi:MAG TPA: alpha-L-arabinofuranosidase C-terminal domain-containing protein [Fimbriimonadaceae bacterium]|jgi:alpha-N-arabinofuranosidase